jgi:hypothetical protein
MSRQWEEEKPLQDVRSLTGALPHSGSKGKVAFHADEPTMAAFKLLQKQLMEMEGHYLLHSAVARRAVQEYAKIVAEQYERWKAQG